MESSEWTDVASPAASGGWTDVVQVPEVEKPSYNVDLKSRKSKAQNQLEMLKRNPDIAAMPQAERDRILKSAQQSVGLGSIADRATRGVYDSAMEIPRFLGDTGAFVGNAIGYGLKSAASAGQGLIAAVPEAARTGSVMEGLDKGAATFAEKQKEYTPSIQSPMSPSDTGQILGDAIQPAANWIDTHQSDPELSMKLLNLMAISPLKAKAAKINLAETAGKTYGAGKAAMVTGVPNVAASLYGMSPAARPSGIGTYTESPTVAKIKQATMDRLAQKAPEKVENVFHNSAAQMSPLESIEIDPQIHAANRAKSTAFIDELLQQQKEGRLTVDDGTASGAQPLPPLGTGGASGVYGATKVALNNMWDKEIAPVIQNATSMGVRTSMEPLAKYYSEQAGLLKDAYPKAAAEAARLAEVYRTQAMTPWELQKTIAAANEQINWKALPVEEGQIARMQKGDVAIRRQLLDNSVATGLDEMGLGDLKGRYGALRHGQDMLQSGLERQLKNEGQPSKVAKGLALPIVGGSVFYALMSHNPLYLGLIATPKVISAVEKWYTGRGLNPDVAINRMIKARKALGPTERQVMPEPAPEPATMPQNLGTLDPSTGRTIPARTSELTGINEGVPAAPPAPAPYQPVERNLGPAQPKPKPLPVMAPDKVSGAGKVVPDAVVARFEAAVNGKAAPKILQMRAKEMGFGSVEEALAAIQTARRGGL